MVYLMILICIVTAVWAGCLALLGTTGVSWALLFTLFTAVVFFYEMYCDYKSYPD